MADIRNTLARTRAATYSVALFRGRPDREPAGTGFFVTRDGLFATAAHVIRGGQPIEVVSADAPSLPVLDRQPVFVDEAADFALLRIDTRRAGEDVPFLDPSDRVLDEGESVYSHGYPLTKFSRPLIMTVEQMRVMGMAPLLDRLRDADGNLGTFPDNATLTLMTHKLSPRTTSAIVASTVEYVWTLDPDPARASHVYVIDKPLNPGNSGGPIVATETGRVHAFCARYQPVNVAQPAPASTVTIPSLYGVVVRLTHPTIRDALEAHGAQFLAD